MPVILCVLLWARDGQEARLAAYEDHVLGLLPGHGGRVVQRVRRTRQADDGDGPLEVQILQFPSQADLDGYTGDPRRTALAAERDAAIARTQIIPVRLVLGFRS
jgi:uncharacterized protein (DUF1330 family)